MIAGTQNLRTDLVGAGDTLPRIVAELAGTPMLETGGYGRS
ncbi:hypothetical protein [Kribbella sp. CWNU-51]